MKMRFVPNLSLFSWILSFCVGASPQVFSPNPRLFAPLFQALEIQAWAEGQPDQVLLRWSSSLGEGLEEMTWDPEVGYWVIRLPAEQVQGEEFQYQILADYDGSNLVESPDYTVYLYSEEISLPVSGMVLRATVLARHRWNESPEAFCLVQEPDGTAIGPAAIVCKKDEVHILDTAGGRILTYDLQGRRKRQTLIPTQLGSDLILDPSDDSFLVISQAEDRVHRIRPGRPLQTQPLGVARQLAYPARFRYDPSTETLLAQDGVRQNRWTGILRRNQKIFRQPISKPPTEPEVLAEVQDGKILVKSPRQKAVFSVSFDKPVRCVEETLENQDGVIWLLFTLEGDYRIRRFCRIDPERKTAQTAQIDVWFSFEATRRMDAADRGIVLLAGDEREGRMILFDYQGELP